MADPRLLGLLAEFPDEDALLDAARKARKQGYRCMDAFTPFPVEGMAEILRFHDRRIGWLSIIGGFAGFFGMLLVQLYVNADFPIDVGGRPILAWPAFFVVDFEIMVLGAVLVPVIGMFYLNGLPRLHHPLFATPRFGLASDDRFFLFLEARDRKFDGKATRRFLRGLKPAGIEEVLE
jgi:hypothetical protein